MAKEASNSPGNQIEMSENDQPSNLHEFRVGKKIKSSLITNIKLSFLFQRKW